MDSRRHSLSAAILSAIAALSCLVSAGCNQSPPRVRKPVTTRPPVTQLKTTSTTTWNCRHIGDLTITIDGKLDDDAWKKIEPLQNFTLLNTHAKPVWLTTAKIAFDEDNLYLAFDCAVDAIRTQATKRDQHVWEGDAVELFLAPKGPDSPYYEINFTPKNIIYDCRLQRPNVTSEQADQWAAAFNPGTVSQTQIHQDASGKVTGWTLEAAIPFRDLDLAGGEAPPNNEAWLFNIYRGVLLADNKSFELQHWGIVEGHFHQPAQFPLLKFTREP